MASEKAFENKVKGFLKKQNCWFVKTWSNGVQRSGIPDILVCCNGYFVGVEVKAPNGKPSELQLWNLKKIEESGGYAVLLYPEDFEIFKKFISYLNNNFQGRATHLCSILHDKIDKYNT